MSIAAFYRNWLPFTQRYSYYKEGDPAVGFLPYVFVKGNVQPWKQGLVSDLTQVGIIYRDYKTIYVKNKPEFDLSGLPPDAVLEENPIVFWDGYWFNVQGNQDWTTAGRAPKHYKYLAIRRTIGPGDEPIPEPTPIPELVSSFELIVSELNLLTPIVIEGLN